jgi:hypothetical protein
VLEKKRLLALGKRIEALEALETPTEAEDAEYEQVLDRICRAVLLAPAAVFTQLALSQRAAIALTFSRLWLRTSLLGTEARVEAAKAQGPTIGEGVAPRSCGPEEGPAS